MSVLNLDDPNLGDVPKENASKAIDTSQLVDNEQTTSSASVAFASGSPRILKKGEPLGSTYDILR
jgi:hypothetical protein